MISVATPKKYTISNFEDLNHRLRNNAPLWLNDFRQEGLQQFSQLGLPTPHNEEWKYTNVLPICEKTFHLPGPEQKTITELEEFKSYKNNGDIEIVFVNGFFSPTYSTFTNLPRGVTISNITNLTREKFASIQSMVSRHPVLQEEAFAALNQAFTADGTVIEIGDSIILKKLIHIIHVVSNAQDILTFPKTLVVAGKSSEAAVLESYVSFSQSAYFANALTDISLAENAKIKHYKIQAESKAAFHIGTTRVTQERDSQFESFSFSTGALLARNNLTITLNGSGANAVLNGLYAAEGEQHIDNHTTVEHNPPNCISNQLYKGILEGNARAVFNGKILVRREAQQTNSYQLNKNLLLGAGCQANTKPQLEIFADDVRCTHGATIGQLNEDELFYLGTRAIPRQLAVKMLCRGFVDDVLGKIPHTSVHEKMDNLLAKAFSIFR